MIYFEVTQRVVNFDKIYTICLKFYVDFDEYSGDKHFAEQKFRKFYEFKSI